MTKQHQQHLSTPPADPDEGPNENISQQQLAVGVTGDSFISASSYIPTVPSTGSFDQHHQPRFEAVNTKRPRYTAASQWKLSPSTFQQHQQQKQTQTNILTTESSPSPTTQAATNTQTQQAHTLAVAASSSDTASSPSHSPWPSPSAASGHETTNPEGQQIHQQLRKGKYVSPVWKPNEMLWLARAWRVQYQGGSEAAEEPPNTTGADVAVTAARGKTRADKDREVAEFLNRHGVNRDAKTAGTKWDNMLGEFRKVYEWERGGERDQIGKSYFRLSPYERKLHRLPASFDEEVFEELSLFMGSRMRTPQSRGVTPIVPPVGGY